MKKVTKAEAFKALAAIIDDTQEGGEYLSANDVITVTRFIEQQWEPEEQTETVQTAKSEGTI